MVLPFIISCVVAGKVELMHGKIIIATSAFSIASTSPFITNSLPNIFFTQNKIFREPDIRYKDSISNQFICNQLAIVKIMIWLRALTIAPEQSVKN